ncbi:MAG: Xaa-Pro peptidase family protein [Pseudomonadota bacterium]
MNDYPFKWPPADTQVDRSILEDAWSDLRRFKEVPEIDFDRLHAYRTKRLRAEMQKADVALLILINPISLRYAIDYSSYQLFQSHIPETYLFMPQDGPIIAHGVVGETPPTVSQQRPTRPLAFFDAGTEQSEASRLLADDVVQYMREIGCENLRIAVECVNPSLTQALMQRGFEVLDGIPISEAARVIKSEDEIACIRWAIAVAEHGMAKMHEILRPGITELQLWGILNYTNLANHGGWHEGRMLCSGPRTNPWLQEATQRTIESGDLVGFDTDMVGPMGYFADISRTFYCGPGKPSKRQKELYRLALDEIEHNIGLIRPGITAFEIQDQAFPVPEEFQEQAYVCLLHAAGMCDEYPRISYPFRERNFYNATLEKGMVLCMESYMGAVGERDGVKIEQMVLVTDEGCEMLSTYPLEEALLD